MRTIKQTYFIAAPPSAVYRALVDAVQIGEWSGSPAIMDDRIGTAFSLWDGSIFGTNLEVEPGVRLVQRWRASDWAADSTVTITLAAQPGGTLVELVHEDVPDDQADDYEAGWDGSYFGLIKEYLEKT